MLWSTGLRGASKSSSRRRDRRAGGFTLLEIIVAFTILAVALTALMQAFSSGLRGLGSAGASAIAALYAKSKMDEIGAAIPLEPATLEGTYDDGYKWSAAIRVHETGEDPEVSRMVPYEVEVTVAAPDGASVRLTTLRLGPAP